MNIKYFVLPIIILLSQCALLDGYKDNTHAMYAKMLTSNEIQKLLEGDTIEKTIDKPYMNGKLLVYHLGNERYNFIEIGKWDEHFITLQNGAKREIMRTTEYDNYGNVRKRVVYEINKKTQNLSIIEEWKSNLKKVGNDTVLIQNITSIQKKQTYHMIYKVINYQSLLSDRLKEKIELDTLPSSSD